MEIKDTANPVGNVVADEGIDNFLELMAALWDQTKTAGPWWQFWKRRSFVSVTTFLIKALEDLIAYVDGIIDDNIDKKATVLAAISKLYDYVIQEAMPIWLKPFSPAIKEIIINGVISPAIDWIVDKYRNGEWRKKEPEEVAAQWATMKMQMTGVPGGHRPK